MNIGVINLLNPFTTHRLFEFNRLRMAFQEKSSRNLNVIPPYGGIQYILIRISCFLGFYFTVNPVYNKSPNETIDN
jgi:hypothetical protein